MISVTIFSARLMYKALIFAINRQKWEFNLLNYKDKNQTNLQSCKMTKNQMEYDTILSKQ